MWIERLRTLYVRPRVFPPAALDEIAGAEAALGLRLPNELRGLLMETNGAGHSPYDTSLIWSAAHLVEENRTFRTEPEMARHYMPFDALLFFADAGNGDCFAHPIVQGRARQTVFMWDHKDDSRRCVAPTLDAYLKWRQGTAPKP